MRWSVLLLLVGCRQIFGIDDPRPIGNEIDASTHADALIDAEPFFDGPCSDTDHDGICDSVDDWPCGVKPAAPGDVEQMANGVTTDLQIKNFNFQTTTTKFLVVTPNSSFHVLSAYTIHDTSCANACVDQIELGFVPGGRAGCAFDNTVPKGAGAAGNIDFQMTAPTAAGSYRVESNIAQRIACNQGNTSWYPDGTPPPEAQTLGYVCVQ